MSLSQWITNQRHVHLAVFGVALFYSSLIVMTRGIETTLLMATFGTLSLALATRSSSKWGWLISGMCFALAFISKPPIATQFPALCLAILFCAPPQKRLTALIWMGFGASIGIGSLVLWGISQGNLWAIWERAILANIGYATGTESQYTPEFTYLFRETLPMMLPLSLLSLLACWQLWRESDKKRVIIWGVWAVTAVIGSLTGQALKITYFLQLLPAIVVMSAFLLTQQKIGYRIVYLLGLIVVMIAPKPYLDGVNGFVVMMHDPESPLVETAQYLEAHTNPDECLWLWGHLSGLSYHAHRNSCTSASQDALVANAVAFDVDTFRPEFMQNLLDHRPRFLINTSAWGFFPMLEQFAGRYITGQIVGLPLAVFEVDMRSYQPTQVQFADLFTLIGIDQFQSDQVCAGDSLGYATTWRVQNPPLIYYQMFVQLRDADNQRIAGLDLPPSESFPTQVWDKGAIILGDTFQLLIPPDTRAGTYTIALGFYNPDDLASIPVYQSDGTISTETIIATLNVVVCQN